ncbi:MAG: oligosaccharide flippase family protein [Planctomycetes bacterium]|nr:oligosaccharide flippase family protein [Planctomycetota bacterium]
MTTASVNDIVAAGAAANDAGDGVAQGRIGRNLCWMGAAVFLGSALQYALYFWIARYLGPAEYGLFSTVLTIAILTGPLVDLGMGVTLVWVAAKDPAQLAQTIGSSIVWRAVLTAPMAIVAAIVVVAQNGSGALALFVPLYLATHLDGLGTMCSTAFQARERMDLAASTMLTRNLLRAASFGIALFAGAGVVEIAWWVFAGSVLGVCWSWRRLRRTMPVSFARPFRWDVVRGALPFGLGIIASMAHQQIDVVLLGALAPREEVGIYHAGVRFYILAQLVAQTVAVVVQPLSYRHGLKGTAESVAILRLKTAGLAALGTLGALVFALCADDLVGVVLGGGYAASVPIVLATAPLVFLKFVSSPLADTITCLGRRTWLTVGLWLSLAVNVGANLVLIPRHGALGAVIACVISECVLAVWLFGSVALAGVEVGWHTLISECVLAVWLFGSVALAGVEVGWHTLLRNALALSAVGASLWWAMRGMAVPVRGEWVAGACVVTALLLAALRPTTEESVLKGVLRGRRAAGV